MRLILKPDWDPRYHYHVNGKKVVITKEDWKKYKNNQGGNIDNPSENAIYKASYELPEVNVVSKKPFTVDDAIQKSINDVNSFYYNDVVPRLLREHKGLKTTPDTRFPYIDKEDIVENQSFRDVGGFATPDLKIHTVIRPSLTINANNEASFNEDNYLYRELLAHENTHRWQYDLPKRDRSYTKKSKKLLNAAYIPGEGLNRMYGPLWPLFKHPEQEAENRKARYVIWQKLKNELGRTPTIEETDDYIKNILFESDILKASYSYYFKNPKLGKSEDEYQKQIDAIREALIHVASNEPTNDSIKNRINYAAKGSKLISKYQIGGPYKRDSHTGIIYLPYISKIKPYDDSKTSVLLNKPILSLSGKSMEMDNKLLIELDDYLKSRNVGLPLRLAILYNVVQEGSTTKSHRNGACGLLGWRGVRIPGKGINQMEYLYNTIFGKYNANHWKDGSSLQAFINAETVEDALNALTHGYVRPGLELREFRSKTKYFNEDEKVN